MTVGRGAVFKTNDSNKTPTPMGVHVAEQLSKNVNGHSRAVIQKREPTAIAASIRKVFGRFHPGAVPPWRCSTLALFHPGAVPPWRCSTLALLHPGAAPPWRCSTLALLHPGAAPPWRCSTLALLPPGAAPPGRCSTLALLSQKSSGCCQTAFRRVVSACSSFCSPAEICSDSFDKTVPKRRHGTSPK